MSYSKMPVRPFSIIRTQFISIRGLFKSLVVDLLIAILVPFILRFKHSLNCIIVTDLEIPVVLVTRLLRRDLDRLVNGIEPVEPWDEG
jgi:hypothetical protein